MPKQQEQIVLESFNTFGELLRYARERARLTQRELAAQIGYHHSYVSYLEKNLRIPEEAVLFGRIIPALGLAAESALVNRMRKLAIKKHNKSPTPELRETGKAVSADKAATLPTSLTSMLGRDQEAARLGKLLARPAVRLITIVGPPGVGKTRLALHVAEQALGIFTDGVLFVNLTLIHQAELVRPALVAVVGSSDLEAALHEKKILILLDNFEQVVEAAAQLLPLLSSAPNIKFLVTSREALRINGEHEFPLTPLPVPDKDHLDSPAVQLFIERARAVQPDFRVDVRTASHLAEICRRLDGLPLAIELAAARIRTFSISTMLEQFDRRFEWLTRGHRELPAWRQTLRGAIQWSYALLSGPERELFNRLAVFAGGWTLEAAEAICSDEILCARPAILSLLTQLVDRSLVVAEPEKARYTFLETLREFANEKLAENQGGERTYQLHCAYYLRFAQSVLPHLQQAADEAHWFNLLEMEHNNLRAALRWATRSPDRASQAMELVQAMHRFWLTRGHINEARRWLTITLAMDSTNSHLRADLLRFASSYASLQGEYDRAQQLGKEALEISRAVSDEAGIYLSMDGMATLAGLQGDYAQAAELLEQVLIYRRDTKDVARLTRTLNNLSLASRRLGRFERARDLLTESIAVARATGNQSSLAHALLGLAEILMELKEYRRAIPLQRESIIVRQQLGSVQGVVFSLSSLAIALHHLGNSRQATFLESASEKLRQEIGLALSPTIEAETANFHAELKNRLGKILFKATWEHGQKLTLEEAVQLALQGSTLVDSDQNSP